MSEDRLGGSPTDVEPRPEAAPQLDSSTTRRQVAEQDPTPGRRSRIVQRVLEIVPGVVTWVLIASPFVLSFRWPEIVAWFVLTFDFYWLYKAVILTASVAITFTRIRRVMAIDWRTRAFALADLGGRQAEIQRLVPLIASRSPARSS